jgi:hypothetical protein
MMIILMQFTWANPTTWLSAFWQAVREGLISAWQSLASWGWTFIEAMMPTSWVEVFMGGGVWDYPVLRCVDEWIPLQLIINLFVIYLQIMASLFAFKIIKNLPIA